MLAPIFLGLIGLASSSHVEGLAFDRFITIWLENQDFAKAAADPATVALKERGVMLTNYFAHTHPSQPNYIAAIGGDYFGLDHDDPVTIPSKVDTIVDLLDWRNIPWAGYFEGIPSPGYLGASSVGVGTDTWDYVRKHNPFVSYESISHNGSRLLNLLSFDDFNRAYAANPKSIPQFVWITPNMLNDGHNTSLEFATSWATEWLTPLLADDAFGGQRTLIQLTYDETEDFLQPNRVVTLLLGNMIPRDKRGTEDPTYYSHYSILSTVEYNWRLPCLGRYDVGANVFATVADLTGAYKNREPPDAELWNNNASYPGYLNSDPEQWRYIPPPNLDLIGAGGEGVLDTIEYKWRNMRKKGSPYDGSGRQSDADRPAVYQPMKPNVDQ